MFASARARRGGPRSSRRARAWHSWLVQRWNDLAEVPEGFGPSAVTIGNFDGVHRGHHAVLRQVVSRAAEQQLPAVAITFEPHPLAVLYPDRAPQPLTTTGHKLELLAAEGLEAVLVMPFTLELAQWSPRRFVEDVLVRRLGARAVVVGGDTRFGHRNAGDVGTLRTLGAELGFAVEVVADLGASGVERRWSSTWVRELVAAGEVARAAELLGRAHRVTGVVVHGDHRGRELGYPTANLAPTAVGAIPADGVYAGWLIRDPHGPGQERLPAAVSVGTNPTFDGTGRRIEAYVLDRTDLDLYGETVAVELVCRLRPTLRFEGVGALVAQMGQDVARCRELLGVAAPSC
jgi:riboflavin kinase/FMN adenylyltransferase